MGLGWCAYFDFGFGSTGVAPSTRLRTGFACPFGLAYALPSTSAQDAPRVCCFSCKNFVHIRSPSEWNGVEGLGLGWWVLALLRPFDSAQDARYGGRSGCSVWVGRFLRLRCMLLRSGRTDGGGSGCAEGAAPSLFVSPVKTFSGLTSVRPERSGAESKGWALRLGSGQGYLGAPMRGTFPRRGEPFDVRSLRMLGAGAKGCPLGGALRRGSGQGGLAHLGWLTRFLRLRCTPLCSVPLRSGRTEGGALRSGPSTRLRMLGMGRTGCAGAGASPRLRMLGLRASLRRRLGWVGFGLRWRLDQCGSGFRGVGAISRLPCLLLSSL